MTTNDDGTNKNLCGSIMPASIGDDRQKRQQFPFEGPFPPVEILATGNVREVRTHIRITVKDTGFVAMGERIAHKRQQKQYCSCNDTHAKPPLFFTLLSNFTEIQ